MDALEFFNEFRRMCNTLRTCEECRIEREVPSTCYNNINSMSDLCEIGKVIEIIEKWSKEHPIKSNLDVFRKTFPDWGTQTHLCKKECDIGYQKVPCPDCKWWDEEYKEGE